MANLRHAMWVHGNSMLIETSDKLDTIERRGDYIKLTPKFPKGDDIEVWAHYAIPTPVIVDDKRLRAGSALFDWNSTACVIRHVRVYDGKDRILRIENRHDFDPIEDGKQRFDIPEHPYVKEGIGISLCLRFSANAGPSHATFYGAGCDFLAAPKSRRAELPSKKKGTAVKHPVKGIGKS